MNAFKSKVLPILLSTIWISISEFARNEFPLKHYWTDHYESMGLIFPADPVNGMVWGVWALVFSISIYIITRKFSFKETVFLAWVVGFVLMWLVTGNMGVLPFEMLYFAVPLSILEVYVATLIIVKMTDSEIVE